MPSSPSAVNLNLVWDIIQRYPELHWSKTSLQETLLMPTSITFSNSYSIAIFSKVLDEAELLLIATHPNHLHQGHAKTLLQEALSTLNLCKIFLEVRTSNIPARRLYEILGFQEYGKRPHYYQDGEDAILYAIEEQT